MFISVKVSDVEEVFVNTRHVVRVVPMGTNTCAIQLDIVLPATTPFNRDEVAVIYAIEGYHVIVDKIRRFCYR